MLMSTPPIPTHQNPFGALSFARKGPKKMIKPATPWNMGTANLFRSCPVMLVWGNTGS
jgi:hypothetical protein